MIFIKIPKTASSTAASVARRIASSLGLHGARDGNATTAMSCTYIMSLRRPFPEPLLSAYHCIRDVVDRFLTAHLRRPAFTWTMVRAPATRCLSHFYHLEVAKQGVVPSLANKLAFANGSNCSDYQVHYSRPVGCARDDAACAFRGYDFVGHVERFDESMVALARVTRMPLAAVVYVAAKTDCSRQDGQQHARCRTSLATPDGDPSPTAVASEPWALRSFFAGEFRRRNRGDYALWDAAKRAISEEASRAGAREKLATFQAMLRRTREGAERCALSESVPSYPNGQYAACLERLFPLPPRG